MHLSVLFCANLCCWTDFIFGDLSLAERAEKAAAEAKKQEEADAKAAKEAEKAARIVSCPFSSKITAINNCFRYAHSVNNVLKGG